MINEKAAFLQVGHGVRRKKINLLEFNSGNSDWNRTISDIWSKRFTVIS